MTVTATSSAEHIDPAADEPAQVNQDPLGQGWFYKVKISNDTELQKLKDETAYNAYIQGL